MAVTYARIGLADVLDEYFDLIRREQVVDLASEEQTRLDYLRGILNQVHLRDRKVDAPQVQAMVVTDARSAALEREHQELVRRGEAEPWQPPI